MWIPKRTIGIRPRLFFLSALGLLTASSATIASAQERRGGRLDAKRRQMVVEKTADLLVEQHLFPEVGKKCAEHIRSRLASGAYDQISEPMQFARQLTMDLRSVNQDAHLRVEFGEAHRHTDEKGSDPEEERQRRYERFRGDNFGFVRIERIDGAIGYLDLRVFAPTDIAGDIAVAAMDVLSGCDAVIIDLRNNSGGSGDMVQLIASYFFAEPTHLVSYETRGEELVRQSWTYAYVPGKRMPDTPLYILTSERTASAAEEFTYDMKHHGRATIVGEVTAGGGHTAWIERVAGMFNVVIPHGRPIHPVTGGDWDGVGVKPDIDVPAAHALSRARLEALKAVEARAGRKTPSLKVKWALESLEAEMNPVTVPEATLADYVGVYGPLAVTLKDGELWGRWADGKAYRVTPLSQTRFATEAEGGPTAFEVRVEFLRKGKGKAVAVELERADIEDSVRFDRVR